jgi:hypothetical protein
MSLVVNSVCSESLNLVELTSPGSSPLKPPALRSPVSDTNDTPSRRSVLSFRALDDRPPSKESVERNNRRRSTGVNHKESTVVPANPQTFLESLQEASQSFWNAETDETSNWPPVCLGTANGRPSACNVVPSYFLLAHCGEKKIPGHVWGFFSFLRRVDNSEIIAEHHDT